MRGGAVTDINALKELFLKTDCSKWSLYRGFHKNMPHSQIIYQQRNDQMDIEDSWYELEHQLTMHSGAGQGQFTIYVPAISGNKGFSWWFQVGAMPFSQPGGVSGLSGAQGYPGLGMIPVAQVELEKRIWELDRRLEDEQAARESQMSIGQQVIDKVLAEVDANQVVTACIGILNRFIPATPQGAPISLQGHPADSVATNPPPTEGYQYQETIIIPILDTIRPSFDTDEEFYQFLTAVSKVFANDPEGTKAIIKSMA